MTCLGAHAISLSVIAKDSLMIDAQGWEMGNAKLEKIQIFRSFSDDDATKLYGNSVIETRK